MLRCNTPPASEVNSMKIKPSFCVFFLIAIPAAGQVTFNSLPSRTVGQAILQQQQVTALAPNLAEGRELNAPESVALDTSTSPPILYVADTANNRVLAWKNSTGFTNGATADLVVGQRDKLSTSQQGPGRGLSTGLAAPVAVAVDAIGNLYVVDAGNNRVVRYPKPFTQSGGFLTVDLIIGQPDLNSSQSNQGQAAPSAQTLALISGSTALRSGVVFDSQGDLWISDAGNNRVLRFPASALANGAPNDPAADLVLGQTDFTSNSVPSGTTRQTKNALAQPSALGFDAVGRLFIADDGARVLVFVPGFFSGMSAARIMGVVVPNAQQPNPPAVGASTLGAQGKPATGIVFVGNTPFVVDGANNRILKYDSYDKWLPEAAAFSPAATAVIGQRDFSSSKANQGQPDASGSTLNSPAGAAFFGNDLYVADSGNNRVLDFPQQGTAIFSAAAHVLGQIDFPYFAPNLIEGREFFFFAGNVNENGITVAYPGGAVAVDTNSNPPRLYVSDPGNNRILGFKDARNVHPGQKADIVIGQPDFYRDQINYPKNDSSQPSDTGLFLPEGIAIDKNGDLWVADSGNGRVVRYPSPFQQKNSPLQANLVLGQFGFTTKVTDPSPETMSSPYGVALTQEGDLAVSDSIHNRVLLFLRPASSDFTNGQPAAEVIGQPDFVTTTAGTPANNGFASPHLIAIDAFDRLYVADTGNNRVAIYRYIRGIGNNPSASFSIASFTGGYLNAPHGVYVDPSSGQIWVANTFGNTVLRFPNYDQLLINPTPTVALQVLEPVAVTVDAFGNPVIAEGANRVSFYYPQLDARNGANYFHRYAPGMLASLFALPGVQFSNSTQNFDSLPHPLPIPSRLADTQVLVNGAAAPVLYVSPAQINFQIPSATPTGTQEFQAVRASTGQVLASGFFPVEQTSPALFTADSTGAGQVSAIDADNGKPNSGTNPVKAGHYISLYGTGQGDVPGGPPDGNVAQGPVNTPQTPQVYIGGPNFVPSGDIQYSGLAPGLVGLWQINVKVPATAAPGPVQVLVQLNGSASSVDALQERVVTTIYVTQ